MPVTIKKKSPAPEYSLATVNSAGRIPEQAVVEKFSCMLAASEIPTEGSLTYPLYASFKYDGIRSPMTTGVAMSRKMLPLPNKFIQAWARRNEGWLHGLDGEIIVGPPHLPTTFNTSTSGVMSQDGEPDFKFYVFDKWDMGSTIAHERQQFLNDYIASLPESVGMRVVLVEQKLINNLEELMAFYDLALHFGYEGLILKSLYLEYKFGRSSILSGHLLKWKEFIDYNCVVLSVKQAMKNTNEKVKDELGRAKRSTAKAGKVPIEEVGGFQVRCVEPESIYYGMEFGCGTGSLTQDQLKALWLIRDQIPGRHLKVKSQKLGGKTLPRFPGWYGWRDPIDMGDAS